MTMVGLELNATCARAVSGPPELTARLLPLDEESGELPLAVSLLDKLPRVGRAGAALCRQLPHLTCLDLLSHLGTEQEWSAGRHRFDAAKALGLIFEQLRPLFQGATALAVAMPAYLSRAQAALVTSLVEKARLPLVGSVSTSLALGLVHATEQNWSGKGVLIDADDHALTCTVFDVEQRQLRILDEQAAPGLSLVAWKECLLNGVADRCILHSRRDPRESATAEQLLYDQLDRALETYGQGEMVELDVQSATWFQNLLVRPEEVESYCTESVRQTLDMVEDGLATAASGRPHVYLVTAAAAHLPGLLLALHDQTSQHAPVRILPRDAAAQGAHDLAVRWKSGELPRGHLDMAVPLPKDDQMYQTLRPEAANEWRRELGS